MKKHRGHLPRIVRVDLDMEDYYIDWLNRLWYFDMDEVTGIVYTRPLATGGDLVRLILDGEA